MTIEQADQLQYIYDKIDMYGRNITPYKEILFGNTYQCGSGSFYTTSGIVINNGKNSCPNYTGVYIKSIWVNNSYMRIEALQNVRLHIININSIEMNILELSLGSYYDFPDGVYFVGVL